MTKWKKYLVLAFAVLATLSLPVACSQSTARESPLDEALTNGVPTLVGFVGDECGCKDMRPILEELADEYDSSCNVVVVDVVSYKDLAGQYQITLTPTLVFLDDSGQEVTRHVGFWSREDVVDQLAEIGVS